MVDLLYLLPYYCVIYSDFLAKEPEEIGSLLLFIQNLHQSTQHGSLQGINKRRSLHLLKEIEEQSAAEVSTSSCSSTDLGFGFGTCITYIFCFGILGVLFQSVSPFQ